jgi:glutathione synthase/RimK-type ligase-like ATP-grasp enzyme
VALDDIESVWMWRPGIGIGPRARAVARFGDATAASYVEHDWTLVLYDALQTRARRWLPGPPTVIRRAEAKLRQLQLAERLGLRVPETLITNDVDAALAFIRARDGDVIVKPPSVVLTTELAARRMMVYTRTLTPRDLVSIATLSHVPVMLQRCVAKRLELRVTVVGERVFAAEIHSQSTRRTQIDWRQYDHAHTQIRAHALPSPVEDRCRAVVRELGLSYGALDLILTPEGEYVFLEINPNGQWAWIEEATGLAITSALCDELLRAERGS